MMKEFLRYTCFTLNLVNLWFPLACRILYSIVNIDQQVSGSNLAETNSRGHPSPRVQRSVILLDSLRWVRIVLCKNRYPLECHGISTYILRSEVLVKTNDYKWQIHKGTYKFRGGSHLYWIYSWREILSFADKFRGAPHSVIARRKQRNWSSPSRNNKEFPPTPYSVSGEQILLMYLLVEKFLRR